MEMMKGASPVLVDDSIKELCTDVTQLQTKHLRMKSWTAELAEAVIHDKAKLGRMLGVIVPDDFSNHAVREHVPSGKVIELRVDPCHGAWSGMNPCGGQYQHWFRGVQVPPDDEAWPTSATISFLPIKVRARNGYRTYSVDV